MIVYVLVPEGVYQHGIIGVYATEDEARTVAERIWPATDGHHTFVIYEREVGVEYEGDWTRNMYGSTPKRFVCWRGDRAVYEPAPTASIEVRGKR